MMGQKEKGCSKMSKTAYRVLWIIAGVLLIVAGVVCMSWEVAALASLALFLGVSMLVSGVVDILIFFAGRSAMFGSGWFLVDGILTVILAVFILFNQAFTMLTLPFVFGMWLIFSGITRFVQSFDLKAFGARGWGWFTAIGLIMALAGVISFLNPVAGMEAISVVLGVSLILEGVSAITRACCAGRFLR